MTLFWQSNLRLKRIKEGAMRLNLFRLSCVVLLAALTFAASGCDQDFYLSESESAAYTGLFADESSANNFIGTSLPGQTLDIQFDNSSQPPTIRSTNLVTLMRNYTTLGIVEGVNQQVQLDRLNTQLQTQLERYIRSKLQIYQGINNAGVRLTQLTSVQINFRNRPTFAFHPERQSIAFNLTVNLTINGTIQVDALDPVTNFIFNVNGTYPLIISVNNLNLSGEAVLSTPFADAAEIGFNLTPTPGTISVIDGGSSSAPGVVKDGVASLIRQQLSQPLRENFKQRYTYFAMTGLGLTQATAQTPGKLIYTYQARPESARPMMHVVARAADGKLYHLRKTEGGPSLINTVQPFPNL